LRADEEEAREDEVEAEAEADEALLLSTEN